MRQYESHLDCRYADDDPGEGDILLAIKAMTLAPSGPVRIRFQAFLSPVFRLPAHLLPAVFPLPTMYDNNL
jgi:hypothetical protein